MYAFSRAWEVLWLWPELQRLHKLMGMVPEKNVLNSSARCVYILSAWKNQIIMEILEEQKDFPDLYGS